MSNCRTATAPARRSCRRSATPTPPNRRAATAGAQRGRGKSGRVVGPLMALVTLMKGQPLTYNKDNQEDKEPLFDTVDTVKDTLRIFAEMAGGITVQPQAMEQAAL